MFTVSEIQKIKQLLRNVAEVDPDDTTANRASQLSVELEMLDKIYNLTEDEQSLIQYAYSLRDQYVLRPGARHAVNTKVELRARQC
jgi:cell fate (sporulation/competence/biofilm development) regulator YlbF (YheA/YmcA/DUF963 family)